MLGFVFTPSNSYACGSKNVKTENKCCKEQNSIKKTAKSCCSSSHSNTKDKSCKGKCGHSNCTSTTPVNVSVFINNELEFKNLSFEPIEKKTKFFSLATFISSGFASVWLIPKIS